jgi:carbon monoxide dehydrogenase subunit G
MDMSGEYRIPAPREQVWAALNDPETLKASLPGCQSLEKLSDREFAATVVAKVGPVQAKFNGNVTLSNLNPPESYTISGEGKGGAAGFAKGGADVRLLEEGEVTVLTYNAKADVGGKLAQLGSRLIDGTAKKMADEFFNNFSRQVAGPEPAAAPAPGPALEEVPEAAPPAAPESLLQNKFVWASAAIVILMIVALLFR